MGDALDTIFELYKKGHNVSTDSRTLKKGDLFFALKGPNFDGNRHAQDALSKGAKTAIIDDPEFHSPGHTMLVDDCLEALQLLSTRYRNSLSIPVLGITGSNGKTTTKELIKSALSKSFHVFATKGNLNNHIGVPMTLLSTPATANFLIVEMGANQPGDITELCHIARPDYGVITNIGLAHLEALHSLEGVFKEKKCLFDWIESHGNHFFVNRDDPFLEVLELGPRSSRFDKNGDDFIKIEPVSSDNNRLWFNMTFQGKTQLVRTQLSGEYNLINCACALRIAQFFHVDPMLAIKGIEEYTPKDMRSQVVEIGEKKIILDGYNANPSSMSSSIDSFVNQGFPNPLIIVGDMLELGESSKHYHNSILKKLDGLGIDYVTVGPCFKAINSSSKPSFETVEEVKDIADEIMSEYETFFIKGSRGIKLEGLLKYF